MKNIGVQLLVLIPALLMCGTAASQTWTGYTTENSGIASNTIKTIFVDESNVAWIGTDKGLSRFDGKNWTTYTTTENIADNDINALAFEVSSYGPEIWLGTNGGVSVIGISETDAISAATPYTPDNTDLVSLTVYAAAVDTAHVKWFGTDKGVSAFTGSEWITYTTLNLLPNDIVMAISAADDGWVYLGTDGGGVSRFDGVSGASPYDTDWSEIVSNNITALFIDSQGNQWIGTDSGVSKHEGHETRSDWTAYTTENGLVSDVVYAITEGNQGVMWFGTQAGVSSFDGETWKTFTTADGLTGTTVNALAVGKDGAIWFGTDNGVSRYSDVSTAVALSSKLPSMITIEGIYPNPFNPATTIGFSLPSDGYVTMDIYNLSGQKVRSLLSGNFSAGAHSTVWNGRNDKGITASSGVYFARLTVGGITASQRMTLVK